MQYKTIILEWLQAQPELYEQLRASHSLLEVMEREARELKTGCESQIAILDRTRPGLDSLTAGSMALEIALEEWQDDFRSRISGDYWNLTRPSERLGASD